MPEIVLSTRATSSRISREVAAGRLKKIAPRLYTINVNEAAPQVIRRNLWDVVGRLKGGVSIEAAQAELTILAAREAQAEHEFDGVIPLV